MTPRRLVRLVAVTIAAPALVSGAASPQAVELVFLNAPGPDAPLIDVPRLTIGVAGAPPRSAVVDTGSTGVVLSASAIAGIDHLPVLGPGTLTYSSSGRIMRGRWVVAPLVIAGRTGGVVTRSMPVLAVDEIACRPAARRCTPEEHPAHVAMLGIGFGRRHDGPPDATPDRNPLLNLAQPAGLRRAYVVTRRGLVLDAPGEAFTRVHLARDAAGTDWSAPPACIAVNGGAPACGTVLVDTGITGMFLTVPPDRLPSSDGQTVASGTPIAIDLTPTTSTEAIRFTVHAGDRVDPATPSTVTLAGIGRRPTFVNTGVHFLNRFDYLYDADAGVVGYRPTGK